MSFIHTYGAYNVEGTFNDWFRVNLTAQGVPGWMPSARIVYDYPETPLFSGHSGHAFSVSHFGSDIVEQYQGRNAGPGETGHKRAGMVAINCWLSKEVAGAAYQQRLRQMGDMVTRLFASAREIEIKHVYGSTSTPTGVGALIRLGGAEATPVGLDPNPDALRRRYLINYTWIERF